MARLTETEVVSDQDDGRPQVQLKELGYKEQHFVGPHMDGCDGFFYGRTGLIDRSIDL